MKTTRLRNNHIKNKSKYRFKRKKKKMFVAEFTGVGFKAVSDYLVEEVKTAGHLFDASYTLLFSNHIPVTFISTISNTFI